MDKGWSFHLGDVDHPIEKTHSYIYGTSKAGACPGVPQEDYDVREWDVVDLPHDWAIRLPFSQEGAADRGYKTPGKAWYRKVFSIPEKYRDKELTIEFEGVASQAVVYFNGSVIHRSFSSYAPFAIDISDRAHFGTHPNVLAVLVDGDPWEGWWYEGAGIYRHVWLNVKNPIHIPQYGLSIRMEEVEDNVWKVNLYTNICNQTGEDTEVRISTTLVDPDQELEVNINNEGVVCEAGEESQVETEFTIEDPKVWDIEEPNIYEVITKVFIEDELVDSDKTVCGFRTIAMDPEKGFILNGRPVKLFGTCNHQDCGGLGVAVPDAIHEYRIERLKAMGSNAYRCAHGMPHKELLDACDKLGMLVIDENRNFETSQEGLEQLRTMVLRDRNHPSVIMYSIFNEEPLQGTEEGMRMARTMRDEIMALDDSRFVTGAMHNGLDLEESAVNSLDVCGINYQTDYYDTFHEKHPDLPVFASETTSAFSVRGCYETDEDTHMISSYDDNPADWGRSIRDTWKDIMDRDYLAGGFMWTGFDYLGEPTPHTWPSVSSYFGLMDTCGYAKDGFYMAKAIFSKKPVCHVLPHWNHRGKEGQMVRVMSHTNCQEAELIVNRKSFGRKSVELFQQVEWEVPYQPGYIELIGYIDGMKVAHDVKITTGDPVRLKIVPWHRGMYNDGRDAMPVNIYAVDENGRGVPDASFPVDISIEGGVILGTSNGDPTCHEDFGAGHRSLFNGRCQAIVQAEQGANQMVISAVAPEIDFASLMIPLSTRKSPGVVESIQQQYLTGWKMTSLLFEEEPDVNMHVEEYDMNTWMDVQVDDKAGAPAIFEDQEGKYGIYRIRTRIPESINGRLPVLHFEGVWGECQVYVNGAVRGECCHEWPSPMDVELQEKDTGTAEIRVLIKSINFGAGLYSMVVFR
jgi:beta-galactosidase